MKLAFLMRFDFEQMRGGDVVQVEAYCRELERMGHQCKLLNRLTSQDFRNYDGFILVNIDRPAETLEYWKLLKRFAPDRKIFVIPIHHPIEAINKFERNRRGLAYLVFNLLFHDFYSREKLKNFVRFRKNRRLLTASLRQLGTTYRLRIAAILRDADGIIYISEGERKSVERDFGAFPTRRVIACNAVEIPKPPAFIQWPSRKYDVVVVGRVEPRKNQLGILKALAGTEHKVCFIGDLNKNSGGYCQEFLRHFKKSEHCVYLGVLPHTEALKIVANSRILLNASYFEVNPLVDLEAALVATQVITTKYSYTLESIPNAYVVDPWNLEDIRSKVESLLLSRTNTLDGARVAESWYEPTKKIEGLILSSRPHILNRSQIA